MDPNLSGFEVSDYVCHGDATYYDNHCFTIRMWVNQDMSSVQRSYSSFCMLDAKLRKKYSRSQLPSLPLSGNHLFSKVSRKKSTNSGTNNRLSLRSSIIGTIDGESGKKSSADVKRVDTSEIIGQKKSELTQYLKSLMMIPVIAISNDIADFFDDESPDGLEFERKNVSEIDIILEGDEPVSHKVKSHFNIPINVDAGSVVVWQFSTKHKDIGFSVDFGGLQVSPYQRYNSHEHSVGGIFEATTSDKIILQWDNSYSKLTSKTLLYTVKVISRADLEGAKQELSDTIKMRHAYDMRRAALRKAFEKMCEISLISGDGTDATSASGDVMTASVHSLAIISTIGSGSSSNLSKGPTSSLLLSEYQQEIHRLQDENRYLQMQLSSTQFALSERSEEADTLREEFERSQQLKETHIDEYNKMVVVLDETYRNVEYERSQKNMVEAKYENVIRELKLDHNDAMNKLQSEIAAVTDERNSIESKHNQLKAEKKQLKALALKFKGDLETQEKMVASLVSDKLELQMRIDNLIQEKIELESLNNEISNKEKKSPKTSKLSDVFNAASQKMTSFVVPEKTQDGPFGPASGKSVNLNNDSATSTFENPGSSLPSKSDIQDTTNAESSTTVQIATDIDSENPQQLKAVPTSAGQQKTNNSKRPSASSRIFMQSSFGF
jgi:hypothetical protein